MVRIQYFRKVFLNCVFVFFTYSVFENASPVTCHLPWSQTFLRKPLAPRVPVIRHLLWESVQTYARANYFACSIRKMRQIGEILRKRIFIVKEEKKHDLGSSLPHDTAIPIIARHALLASVVSICSVLSRIEAWLVAAVTRVWWWLFYQTQQIK